MRMVCAMGSTGSRTTKRSLPAGVTNVRRGLSLPPKYVRWLAARRSAIGASSQAEVIRRLIDDAAGPQDPILRGTGNGQRTNVGGGNG